MSLTAKIFKKIISIGMLGVCIIWLMPVYFIVINTFKSFREVTIDAISLPESIGFENYVSVWQRSGYAALFANTIIVTVISIAGIVILGSMAGHHLSRINRKAGRYLMLYFIFAIIIPFQAVMIPLVRTLSDFSLTDSRLGLIVVYISHLSPMAIFLYYSRSKTIPAATEEMAQIDGSGFIRTFFVIVFPQLAPISATVIVLNSLWIWNDFLLPLITVSTPSKMTLSVGTYRLFVGQYANQMQLGMTAVLMASVPMIILYLFAQRYIVKGITAGAVKG